MLSVNEKEIKQNQFINIVTNIFDKISKYEDIGYFENKRKILLICDNKFHFRDVITGKKFYIKYTLKNNGNYTRKEINNIFKCISVSEKYGFYV